MSQLIREFTHLYGAVGPKDGACCYLIMPAADTEGFQIFLNALAKKFDRQGVASALAKTTIMRDLVAKEVNRHGGSQICAAQFACFIKRGSGARHRQYYRRAESNPARLEA
jgi:hypothetical protein